MSLDMALIPKRPVPLESQRIPLDRRILLRFTSFEWFASEYSANLSMTGMFVRSDDPQPAGTPVEFEFKLEDGLPLIRGKGWVVWSRERDIGKQRPAGMGIEFLELDRESRRLIRWMVLNELPEGREPFDLRAEGRRESSHSVAAEGGRDGHPVSWIPVTAGLLVVFGAFFGHWWLSERDRPVDASEPVPRPETPVAETASSVQPPAPRRAPVSSPAKSEPDGVPVTESASGLEPTVRDWAAAWSRQDVEEYLSFYSRDFVPDSGMGLEEWRATRQVRISRPNRIRIAITGFEEVTADGGKATVRFTQAYRSESYADRVTKTLELVFERGGWRILRERSG